MLGVLGEKLQFTLCSVPETSFSPPDWKALTLSPAPERACPSAQATASSQGPSSLASPVSPLCAVLCVVSVELLIG